MTFSRSRPFSAQLTGDRARGPGVSHRTRAEHHELCHAHSCSRSRPRSGLPHRPGPRSRGTRSPRSASSNRAVPTRPPGRPAPVPIPLGNKVVQRQKRAFPSEAGELASVEPVRVREDERQTWSGTSRSRTSRGRRPVAISDHDELFLPIEFGPVLESDRMRESVDLLGHEALKVLGQVRFRRSLCAPSSGGGVSRRFVGFLGRARKHARERCRDDKRVAGPAWREGDVCGSAR